MYGWFVVTLVSLSGTSGVTDETPPWVTVSVGAPSRVFGRVHW